MNKTKPIDISKGNTKDYEVMNEVRNIGWDVLENANRTYLYIGELVLDHWLDNGSCMSGDVHVQFCEELAGKFRWLTHLIILLKTKRQYLKARKRLFSILKALKLQISPRKTRMGKLRQGFHFLGVSFEVSRNPQGKIQETKVDIHRRTTRRALDKVMALRNNAEHPANIQRYLNRWAAWWHHPSGLTVKDLLARWVSFVGSRDPTVRAVGSGLLCCCQTTSIRSPTCRSDS